jgi:MraZ protein
MAALIGRHINRIDKKGRVSVPKAFRDALSKPLSVEQDVSALFSGIYLYRSFKHPAIEGCDEIFIRRIIDRLDKFDLFSDEQDDLAVTLLENSFEIAYDTEGRIMLPAELIGHAGLSDEALFVGRGTRFQIWQPEAYKDYNDRAFERVKNQGVTLRLKTLPDGASS